MQAWVTLLTQTSYLEGVRTLYQSLRQSRTRYPLVVMVTDTIDDSVCRLLTEQGCLPRRVTPLAPPSDVPEKYANARFAEVWTKLAAWRLTEYERLAFLDADMLVVQNMDEVFETDLPPDWIAACHACRCNPHRIATYPKDWVPANCYYSYLPASDNAPLPADFAPYFNSGFLLLTPDENIAAGLETALSFIRSLDDYQFPEQDLLNNYFRQRWQPLPYIYNALKTLSVQHPRMWNFQEVKNIHYILSKPWQQETGQADPAADPYRELTQLWWDAHNKIAG